MPTNFLLVMLNNNSINNDKVLDLVLNKRFWNSVASGDKTEVYRIINPLSILHFINEEYHPCFDTWNIVNDFIFWYNFTKLDRNIIFRGYDVVCFHLLYPEISMSFKIEAISVKHGEFCSLIWGADPDKYYFVIKLGERIS